MGQLLLLAWCQVQIGLLYGDPPDRLTPVVRASLLPTDRFGEYVSPPLPSVLYIRSLAGNGVAVLGRRLNSQSISAPREFPRVGRARLWQMTYECQIVGPAGPTVVYIDRTALILDR